jgi:hypothetical protein
LLISNREASGRLLTSISANSWTRVNLTDVSTDVSENSFTENPTDRIDSIDRKYRKDNDKDKEGTM